MILGPVSYLDCLVFCLFLAPQLLYRVGLVETVICVIQTLPFLGKCDTCIIGSLDFQDHIY